MNNLPGDMDIMNNGENFDSPLPSLDELPALARSTFHPEEKGTRTFCDTKASMFRTQQPPEPEEDKTLQPNGFRSGEDLLFQHLVAARPEDSAEFATFRLDSEAGPRVELGILKVCATIPPEKLGDRGEVPIRRERVVDRLPGRRPPLPNVPTQTRKPAPLTLPRWSDASLRTQTAGRGRERRRRGQIYDSSS